MGTACASNRVFTIIVTDACQKPCDQHSDLTWTPTPRRPGSALRQGRYRWAATGEPPADSDVLALVRASDNCGLLSTNVTHVTEGRLRVESGFHDHCERRCQNRSTNTLTYTWTADSDGPTFTKCPAGTTNLGCNPTSIPDCNLSPTNVAATR